MCNIHASCSVAGSDYMPGPLQATFPTSSMEGSTSCVDIVILQDMALEGDHSFSVEVISARPPLVMVGTPSEETVTILDDESMCSVYRLKIYDIINYIVNSIHMVDINKG